MLLLARLCPSPVEGLHVARCTVSVPRLRSLSLELSYGRAFSLWSWSRPPPVKFSVVKPEGRQEEPDLSLIPSEIPRPSYALTGHEENIPRQPVIWSHEEISKIRKSCSLASSALRLCGELAVPGTTTDTIDRRVREFVVSQGAYPSPLNFKGFPKSISCSVNNVAAHGIPDSRVLVEGDIVNIDVTVFLDGFHGDCSNTFPIGRVDNYATKLITVARECLEIGIKACGPNKLYRIIGQKIHKHAKANNCTTVPIFLGHGIGSFFHGPPDIYHCLNNYPGRMQPGMVFTVEPCISEGDRRVKILEDGWTAVTLDDSRTAQAEHTILITDSGVEILTL